MIDANSPENTVALIAELAKTILEDPSPEMLASHLALKILAPLDCRGVILGVVQREGFLDLVGTYGYPTNSTTPYIRMPLWTSLPITDATRSGEMNVFNTPEELRSAYPNLSSVADGHVGITVSAPIKYRNTVIGAIGFTSIKAPSNGFERSISTKAILALCGIYLKNFIDQRDENSIDYTIAAKSLSDRQIQVIKLFREDLTVDEMAARLKYSASTIKQDIIKIYELFGVSTRSEVLELAAKSGIAELAPTI